MRHAAEFVMLKIVWLIMAVTLPISCSAGMARDGEGYKKIVPDVRKREWSTADSIGVQYVISNQDNAQLWALDESNPVVMSPNKRHFFIVIRQGDLSCDCNLYTMKIFSTTDVQSLLVSTQNEDERPKLRQKQRVAMRSYNNLPAISHARWINDGKAVLFVGTGKQGLRQIYQLDVDNGSIKQLTNGSHDVHGVEFQGGTILYEAYTDTQSTALELDSYPASVINGYEIGIVLGRAYENCTTLFASYHDAEVGAVDFGSGCQRGILNTWISPDGSKAIGVIYPRNIKTVPTAWRQYLGAQRLQDMALMDPRDFRSFVAIDLIQKKAESILDAPTGRVLETKLEDRAVIDVLWSPDSEHAILVNTTLPLTDDISNRQRTAYIVDYQTSTRQWATIEAMTKRDDNGSGAMWKVSKVQWQVPGRRLLISYRNERDHGERTAVFHPSHGKWTEQNTINGIPQGVEKERISGDRISYFVQESANDPPVIVSSNHGREIAVVRSNSHLSGVRRFDVLPISWPERSGKTAKGGLIVPETNFSGLPFPLVIQAYHYLPNKFLPDGPFPTAYAAQPLASQGVAVVQINIADLDGFGTPQEGRSFVERVDAVVDHLGKSGVIDPLRVGIIGFSRGGNLVYYALTHPGRTRLSAAINADGWTMSYLEYVMSNVTAPTLAIAASSFERQLGGGNFWDISHKWLEHAPGFNVHKVRTPALFSISGKHNLALMVPEALAAFRLNNKPLEFLFFPTGTHHLQRPRERIASLQASVDWMTFWLQSREDPDPAKASYYTRWREMRQN